MGTAWVLHGYYMGTAWVLHGYRMAGFHLGFFCLGGSIPPAPPVDEILHGYCMDHDSSMSYSQPWLAVRYNFVGTKK